MRRFRARSAAPRPGRLRIQHKMNGCPQEMWPVVFGNNRVDGVQYTVRQFEVVGQHNDGNFGPNLLDFIRNDCAIQKSEMIIEHNCVYWARHKNPQPVASIAGG